MGRRCVNAAKDLPPDLFAALAAALGPRSALVWVPARGNAARSQRNAYVLRLTDEGHSGAAVAARLFISERTVRRILAKARAAEKQNARPPRGGCLDAQLASEEPGDSRPRGGAIR
jgi:DNA-binding NarL/FixJ family response regulator